MPQVSLAEHWTGFHNIRHLMIFGDSFSSVGYHSQAPHPTSEEPLGVRFPGFTSCDRVNEDTQEVISEPNWVGHLVKTVKARRSGSTLLVYDYAVGGVIIAGVKRQICREFLPSAGSTPDWASWTSSDSLFVTWIGSNDCGWNMRNPHRSAEASIGELFELQEELYEAGARNFCFIDVAPLHEFPGRKESPGLKEAYSTWNPILRTGAHNFSSAHVDATVLIFSGWDLFTNVLKDPVTFGFSEMDLKSAQSAIFVDGVHPTTAMHAIIARELLAFWSGVIPKVDLS